MQAEHSCSYTIHAATIKDCSEGWASGAKPPLYFAYILIGGTFIIHVDIHLYECALIEQSNISEMNESSL